ncbi:MAG: zf-TFIIB domain-containing protein [Phycisphaeraceae bacterium]|nr:zf-TFIIB domain-containing protein [Phycisphaeraceae bacterium]
MASDHGGTDDPKLNCPHDGQVMEKICLQGNLYVDRCAACGSMWFDPHEMERVVKIEGAVDIVDRKVDTPGRQTWVTGELCCPRDKSPLIHVVDPQQQHVEMHTCGKCSGILLDRGELQDLADFTIKERVIHIFRKIAKK